MWVARFLSSVPSLSGAAEEGSLASGYHKCWINMKNAKGNIGLEELCVSGKKVWIIKNTIVVK